MAGSITHLLLGREFLQNTNIIASPDYGYFMLGNSFPDAGYWPGEDALISDLSHYLLAAKLPEMLYRQHTDNQWKIVALGWQFHLITDMVLHPIINRIAGKYKAKSRNYSNEITYEEDKALHGLIENNLDVMLLKAKGISNFEPSLNYPSNKKHDVDNVIMNAYGMKIDADAIHSMISKLPRRMQFIKRFFCWKAGGKWAYRFLQIITEPIILFTRKETASIMKSFLRDITFDEDDRLLYTSACNKLLAENQEICWFDKYWNFDTGEMFKPGRYSIADELFKQVQQQQICKTELWSDFVNQQEKGD